MNVGRFGQGHVMRIAATISLALVACGPVASQEDNDGAINVPATNPGDGGTATNSAMFIPLQRDFQGFSAWTHFDVVNQDAIGDGIIHKPGKRTVYINNLPPSGQTKFPVGTIIVKTLDGGETLARVKRGGNYNKSGAVDWEWFELQLVGTEWVIVWRGITPPLGFCYGGIVGGACNECHGAYANNDFVASGALDLTKF